MIGFTSVLLGLAVVVAGIFVYSWVVRPGSNGTPPGPMGFPLIGYVPFLEPAVFKTFHQWSLGKYPQIFSIYLGKDYVVVLQDYEAVKAAFVDQSDVFSGRPSEFITDHLSEGKDGKIHGIISLEGERWRQTSHFSHSTFFELGLNSPRLDDVMVKQAQNVINGILQQKGPVDPGDHLYPAMVNILSNVMFGRSLSIEEHKSVTRDFLIFFNALAGSPIQQYPWLRFIPGTESHTQWAATKYTLDECWKLLEKELDRHEKTYKDGTVRDFMDAYIRHNRGGDDKDPVAYRNKDDLITSMMTLWAAGPEATTTANLWAFMFMATYPDVQKKVHEEIDRVVGRDRPITTKDRENLPYTLATMYEYLRLGGDAPLGNPRSTVKETQLLGYRIPERARVFPNIYSIHRNGKYFKDPERFNPERFIGSDGKVHVPPQFILWSAGERRCPGRDLSPTMVFITFANLMQKVDVRVPTGGKLPPFDQYQTGVSSRPLHYKVTVTARP